MSLKYFFMCLFTSLSISAMAQTAVIDNVTQKLDTYLSNNIQEKIYLHLDKQHYSAGETIWFKAYTTVGIENLLSNMSGVGYVELIGPEKKIIKSLTIPMTAGLGIGDIELIDTLTEGSYRIRAYTNWMRNNDDAYFYDRTIQISNGRSDNVVSTTSFIPASDPAEKKNTYVINLKNFAGAPLINTNVQYRIYMGDKTEDKGREKTDDKGDLTLKTDKKLTSGYILLTFESTDKRPVKKIIPLQTPSDNSLQLLPEGGILLDNTLSKIGVKALKPNGMGIKVKGKVMDNKKEVVAEFETNELGIGSFTFNPFKDQQYMAEVTFEDGSVSSAKLPETQSSGISVAVNPFMQDRIAAQYSFSPDRVDQKEVYLLVQHLGELLYVAKQKVSKSELLFMIPKKNLPTGIYQITLLSEAGLPLVERMVFSSNPQNILPLKISTDKTDYTTRSKVNVRLDDAIQEASNFASLSASVINLNRNEPYDKDAPNIYSQLLLSSDIKGYIERPGYYFENPDSINITDLDNLMITQGWRKIEWQKIDSLANTKPAFEPEKMLSIKGVVRKYARKATVPNAKLQLISTRNFMDFIDTTANADGRFNFDDLVFPDSVKFLISATDEKGKKNVEIDIDPTVAPFVKENKNAPEESSNVNFTFQKTIKENQRMFAEMQQKGLLEKTIFLEEVAITRRVEKKAAENSRNLNGSGRADQILTEEDLQTCPTLEMCLNGRLMGVYFQGGIPYNTRGNVPMQVVYDGMYIEADQLSMINTFDIESIEVLRSPMYTAIYGSYGGGGLIVISSKTGKASMTSNFDPKGIATATPKGFHLNKTFFKPDYEVNDPEKAFARDYRSTIHWEPNLLIKDEKGTNFSFFTSDEKGTYQITLEGVDTKGRIGRKVLKFDVK
ncbi:TonB-dependent receptor plug domain-containing protein [Sphingobacterium spiritivorum]|uniref:TonB-dependent receptor n=1 Tax=Sphingobacterium spiritivorum TaxID=258 RepID=UPI003DA3F4D5